MLRTSCLIAMLLAGCASPGGAAETPATCPTTAPTTSPATAPATAPAPEQAPLDPAAARALEALEAAGKDRERPALTADVVYTEEEILFQDVTVMSGRVYYQREANGERPARFRIHFDRISQGRRRVNADRDYVFLTDEKGQWLISRNADIKQQVTYQIARPGEATDPLALGKGPFPLPFGQKKADVLRHFGVTTRPLGEAERKELGDVTYLLLEPTPRAAADLKVSRVELWVDPKGLPAQIRLRDLDAQVEKTARFTNAGRLEKLPSKVFELPSPGPGWEVRVEPLPRAAQTQPGG